MATTPTLRTPELRIARLLARMAARALSRVALRAFPAAGGWVVSQRGERVRPLSRTYRWYKSGTRPYKNAQTRAKAQRKRASSGLPGRGPLVSFAGGRGGRRRLGPRSTTPDQRLTDQTAKALGILERSATRARIGFRTARARKIALFLQRRNRFFGLTSRETDEVVSIARREASEYVRGVRIEGGTIRIALE